MASALEQAVASVQLNDYMSLVMITAVGYDYVLTFSNEVEYVWNKPWSLVSTLFVLARYFGLFNTIFYSVCYIFALWSFWIFLCAAELVMILRVRALYNQSRLVLCFLLAFYVMEAISLLAYFVILSVQWGTSFEIQTVQVSQYSIRVLTQYIGPVWLQDLPVVFTIIIGVSMCLLTIVRLIKELLQMYKLTRRIQLNTYIKCLVRDGTIYFVAILIYALFNLLVNAKINTAKGWLFLVNDAAQNIPPVTLVPRFVLSLRKLYACNTQIGGSNVDTAFGFGSGHALQSTVVFANAWRDGGEGWGDGIEEGI